MMSRTALIYQEDLTRIAKGLRNAGIEAWRVVLRTDGSVELFIGTSDAAAAGGEDDIDDFLDGDLRMGK